MLTAALQQPYRSRRGSPVRRCKGLSGASRSYTPEAEVRIKDAKCLNARWLQGLASSAAINHTVMRLSAEELLIGADCR